jgi:hypothetical protein
MSITAIHEACFIYCHRFFQWNDFFVFTWLVIKSKSFMSFHWEIVSQSPPGMYRGVRQLFGAVWGLIAFRVAQACCRIITRTCAHARMHTHTHTTEVRKYIRSCLGMYFAGRYMNVRSNFDFRENLLIHSHRYLGPKCISIYTFPYFLSDLHKLWYRSPHWAIEQLRVSWKSVHWKAYLNEGIKIKFYRHFMHFSNPVWTKYPTVYTCGWAGVEKPV